VNRAALNLAGGKRFVVTAQGLSEANRYVASVTLNGRPLTRGFIRHDEIMAGGTLAFRMAAKPNRTRATAPADRPYSMSR
jgi:putative alpha-1,2-mannosidase